MTSERGRRIEMGNWGRNAALFWKANGGETGLRGGGFWIH
jgi:hypothetical protein